MTNLTIQYGPSPLKGELIFHNKANIRLTKKENVRVYDLRALFRLYGDLEGAFRFASTREMTGHFSVSISKTEAVLVGKLTAHTEASFYTLRETIAEIGSIARAIRQTFSGNESGSLRFALEQQCGIESKPTGPMQ